MTEEGVTRSRRSSTELLLVVLIGLCALALRLAGIGWGLPNAEHLFSYHPDEIFLLQPAFGFAQGDWNPHFFNYGTLYIYLVGIPAVALGLAPDPSRFPLGLAPLYLEGRLITAALGAASVTVLYYALRAEGRRFAALSALLLALCPLHVVTSHYATVDVPATFFLTLAALFSLRACERPSPKVELLAGAAVGLAAATKYNAGLFLVPVLFVPLLCSAGRARGRWWLTVPAGAALGFLVGCPYAWSPEFLRDLRFEAAHMQAGGTFAFVGTGSGWAYHLLRGLPVGLGYPLLLAGLAGVVAAVVLPCRAARLSLFWVILYLGLVGLAKERFIRYLVPLTPFLAVLAAAGLLAAVRLARRPLPRAGMGLLAAGVVMLTGLYAVGQATSFVGEDARDTAWAEVRDEVRRLGGARRVGLTHSPWFFHPPVSPFNAGALSAPAFAEWNRDAGDRVAVTGWEAARLTTARPDLFFLSDLESKDLIRLRDPEAHDFLAALGAHYRTRKVYARATPPFAWLAPGREHCPPDWLYQSPHVTLYERAEP